MIRVSGGRLGLGIVVLLLLAAPTARGETLTYRYGPVDQLRQEVPNPGTALGRLQTTSTQPAGLTAAPDLPRGAQYMVVRLGEGPQRFLAALDPLANGSRGALYVDTDGDGDLAEEEALEPGRMSSADVFGPIAVRLKRQESIGPYHFCIMRWRYSSGDYWRLVPSCYNVGEVTIGAKRYRMAVIDGTGNGLFNDLWSASTPWPDHAYVDWDGDGKFGSKESLNCTRRYLREGQWYEVSLSADGLEVSFTPTEFPMGSMTFGDFDLAAQFVSGTGQGGFSASGRERIELPADDYFLLRDWVKRTDDAGALWEASGSGEPNVKFTIRQDEDTTVKVGMPFTASLQPATPGPYRAGQTIGFTATVVGSGGKDYRFTGGGTPQPAPKMVIRDEEGKQIGSYAFQYG